MKVSEQGYVPYGWQFPDEKVGVPAINGKSINCLAMISRDNRFLYRLSEKNINSEFVLELSLSKLYGVKSFTIFGVIGKDFTSP
jgi:hypothetical protein